MTPLTQELTFHQYGFIVYIIQELFYSPLP